MAREWAHIKLLKRSGQGHDPNGRSKISPGQAAVLCPACPHPGKNLPEDWENAPQETRYVRFRLTKIHLYDADISHSYHSWLYRLFIGIDANFRVKRKQVSSDTRDPDLNSGMAYFVEEKAYKTFLSQFDRLNVDDVSTCNNHDALAKAGSKRAVGLAATGIATIECTRHDMKRPSSVGDLQKGER